MNIKNFSDLNNIFGEIKEDKHSNNYVYNRFPIRFIFLPDFEALKKVYHFLTSENDCINIDLTKLLPHDDGWITPDNILNSIREEIYNDNKKDIIVLPLSEIIRFYSNKSLISIFRSLCSLENIEKSTEKRIYIPIVGMHERFKKNFESDYSREWGPIWKLNPITKSKLEIFICSNPNLCKKTCLTNKDYNNIDTTKKWLELWKNDNKKIISNNIILHSKTISKLYQNSEPDSFFSFNEISNYKTIIKIIHNIDIPIDYLTEEQELWKELDNLLKNKFDKIPNDFHSLITSLYNIKRFEKNKILNTWIKEKKLLYRWLLKNYLINNFSDELYIIKVIKNLPNLDDNSVETELWTRIFKIENRAESLIKERLKCLRDFYKITNKSPNNMNSIIKHELDILFKSKLSTEEKLRVLTDLSDFEKKLIFELSKVGIDKKEITREELSVIYEDIFPLLYHYIKPISVDNINTSISWALEYFNEYKWSKLLNKKSDSLIKLLCEINKNEDTFYKWYHNIKPSYSFVQEESNKESDIIWVDALGFEWASLVYHLISNDYNIKKFSIARSNIPTITDCNRFEDIKPKNHIMDLDSLIHGEHNYQYPESFIREIETIENICNNINADKKNIIVSDHGLSAFVLKKHGVNKKYNFEMVEHEGRCMWAKQQFTSDSDYLCHPSPITIQEKFKYVVVPLRHDSLKDVPRREVHGGATPEEIIVPYLVISKEAEKIKYKIHPNEFKIRIGENEIINIVIEPKPYEVILVDNDNNKYSLSFNSEKDKWFIDLRSLKLNTGKYTFSVFIDNKKVGEIIVIISGGMVERDLI